MSSRGSILLQPFKSHYIKSYWPKRTTTLKFSVRNLHFVDVPRKDIGVFYKKLSDTQFLVPTNFDKVYLNNSTEWKKSKAKKATK